MASFLFHPVVTLVFVALTLVLAVATGWQIYRAIKCRPISGRVTLFWFTLSLPAMAYWIYSIAYRSGGAG